MLKLPSKNLKRLPKKNYGEIKRLMVNFERRLREIDKKADTVKYKILSKNIAKK